MRPSPSATIRRCAASRSRWAAIRRAAAWSMAASYEARQFGVRSAMSMAKALRLCPPLVIARPDFQVISRGLAAGVRDLPFGDAARRAAVARRGVSRRHRERVARAARHDRREAAESRGARGHQPHRLGRRRAQQVPREDCVGLAEAGRPDGDCARTRRVVPAAAPRRRALGRRPRHGRQAARGGSDEARRRARRRSRRR